MKGTTKPKGLRIAATVLLAALLIGVVFVPAVSAIPADTKSDERDIITGKGGVTQNKVPVTDAGIGILATGKVWTANTDIWHSVFTGMHSDPYSQSRDDESAWDIDTIAVRGRAWRNDVLKMDETDTREDSADAQIEKVVCTGFCGGNWAARGDHTFEESGYVSWYPITEDTWKSW